MGFISNKIHEKPLLMGILNITPDSFSDGGVYHNTEKAINRARKMLGEGADIIDIGGESTRPYAPKVPEKLEIERVLPVIEAVSSFLPSDKIISIDTQKPVVMDEAVRAGAGMINDVNAFRADGAIDIAVKHEVPVCLMHMSGTPQNMQNNPEYSDIIDEISSFLLKRADTCLDSGMSRKNIIFDPGLGFGKTCSHNLEILARLNEFTEYGFPLLIGASRKSFIEKLSPEICSSLKDTGIETQRLGGSIASIIHAYYKGARIFRVHDVAISRQAFDIIEAIEKQSDSTKSEFG